MKHIQFIALVLLYASSSAFALDVSTKIISQPDAPLQVTSYEAGNNSADLEEGTSRWIWHNYNVKRVSAEAPQIVALEVGVVSFDVWDQYIDKSNGLLIEDIDPDDIDEYSGRAFADTCLAPFFHTGFIYISKIRFVNGKIWRADLDSVASEIRNFKSDFNVKKLSVKDLHLRSVCD